MLLDQSLRYVQDIVSAVSNTRFGPANSAGAYRKSDLPSVAEAATSQQ